MKIYTRAYAVFTFAISSVACKARRTRTTGDGVSGFGAKHTTVTGISSTAFNDGLTMPAFKANFTNTTVIVQLINATPCIGNVELILRLLNHIACSRRWAIRS